MPRLVRGELVGAIAMTEPGAGSDLRGITTSAVRDGDHYVVNGSKTFITNGLHANLICLVVRTDPEAGSQGFTLLMVETEGLEGFTRGSRCTRSASMRRTRASCTSRTAACPSRRASARARASTS